MYGMAEGHMNPVCFFVRLIDAKTLS
jgi:hypothetical protein